MASLATSTSDEEDDLNKAYIAMFVHNYNEEKSEKKKRGEFTSTKKQGSLSIRNPGRDIEGIKGLSIWDEENKAPSSVVVFKDVLAGRYNPNAKYDILKTHYCYATGGLIVEYNNGTPFIGGGGDSFGVLTGKRAPHAEIEHVLPWRTMMAIGGGIAGEAVGTQEEIPYSDVANKTQQDWFQELVKDVSEHDEHGLGGEETNPSVYISKDDFKTMKDYNIMEIAETLSAETDLTKKAKLNTKLEKYEKYDYGEYKKKRDGELKKRQKDSDVLEDDVVVEKTTKKRKQ